MPVSYNKVERKKKRSCSKKLATAVENESHLCYTEHMNENEYQEVITMKAYLQIMQVIGREIIDSRGNPTVEAEVTLELADAGLRRRATLDRSRRPAPSADPTGQYRLAGAYPAGGLHRGGRALDRRGQ